MTYGLIHSVLDNYSLTKRCFATKLVTGWVRNTRKSATKSILREGRPSSDLYEIKWTHLGFALTIKCQYEFARSGFALPHKKETVPIGSVVKYKSRADATRETCMKPWIDIKTRRKCAHSHRNTSIHTERGRHCVYIVEWPSNIPNIRNLYIIASEIEISPAMHPVASKIHLINDDSKGTPSQHNLYTIYFLVNCPHLSLLVIKLSCSICTDHRLFALHGFSLAIESNSRRQIPINNIFKKKTSKR